MHFDVSASMEAKIEQAKEWMLSRGITAPRVKISSMYEVHKQRTPSLHNGRHMTRQECELDT